MEKEEINIFLFVDDIIVHIKKTLRNAHTQFLELTSIFSKVTQKKTNAKNFFPRLPCRVTPKEMLRCKYNKTCIDIKNQKKT